MSARSSDNVLASVTWLAIGGFSLGVAALVIVLGAINGFEGELARVVTDINGDIILYTRGEPVTDLTRFEKNLREKFPEIKEIAPFQIAEAMVVGSLGAKGAVIEGYDIHRMPKVVRTLEKIKEGELPSEGQILLGKTLAERVGAQVGHMVRLTLPALDGEQPIVLSKEVKVSGIVSLGNHDYDSKFAYAPQQNLQKWLGVGQEASTFKLKMSPGTDLVSTAVKLQDSLGYPFRAKDWSRLNRNLLASIRLEKVVISVLLLAIILVASCNIISQLLILLHDRSKEFSILKAMGFRGTQCLGLILGIGLRIGALGAGVGVCFGLAFLYVMQRTKFISLAPDIYTLGFLPVKIAWEEVALVVGISLLIACFATLFPAWAAIKKTPMEGIRDG